MKLAEFMRQNSIYLFLIDNALGFSDFTEINLAFRSTSPNM